MLFRSPLSGQARLISVDLPGHGLTGAWPRNEYTVEAYVDFIEALVDTLKIDRFVLVGHSLGGAVAWTFAATRPDRVSQLILVDSAGYPRDGNRRPRVSDVVGIGRDKTMLRPACRWWATSASTSSPSGRCGARSPRPMPIRR